MFGSNSSSSDALIPWNRCVYTPLPRQLAALRSSYNVHTAVVTSRHHLNIFPVFHTDVRHAETMTQMVVHVEVLSAENPTSSSSSSGGHVVDDVTTRRGRTSGRCDTAFQSIEKRFRADLSRRLRHLRVQVEESRGRASGDPDGSGVMPTIAVRTPTGVWTMPRPPRRRCVSYQSVTHAFHSLTTMSPRTFSSSVLPVCSRTLADSSTSLSDDPLTSPEVVMSRDSVTSSTSDLSDVYGASVRTISETDLSATKFGGGPDTGNYRKLDNRETAQRICNSDVVQEPVSRRSSSSDRNRYYNTVITGFTDSNPSPSVHRTETREIILRRHDDARNAAFEPFQQQPSSATLEVRRSTLTTGSRSPATPEISNFVVVDAMRHADISPNVVTSGHRDEHPDSEVEILTRCSSCVPDVTRHGPIIATNALTECSVDAALGSLSSQTGTGSGLKERRRCVSEETTIDSDVCRRSENVDSDGVKSPLTPGRSNCHLVVMVLPARERFDADG